MTGFSQRDMDRWALALGQIIPPQRFKDEWPTTNMIEVGLKALHSFEEYGYINSEREAVAEIYKAMEAAKP